MMKIGVIVIRKIRIMCVSVDFSGDSAPCSGLLFTQNQLLRKAIFSSLLRQDSTSAHAASSAVRPRGRKKNAPASIAEVGAFFQVTPHK